MARLYITVNGVEVFVSNPDEATVSLRAGEAWIGMPLATLYKIAAELHEKWGDLSVGVER